MTLGQALAAKVRLLVWCKSCWHRAEPDVADQVAQYGADTAVTDWARRLRCSACEGHEVRVDISPRTAHIFNIEFQK
jgi:Zn finger protein HypA/HybF involved in hydrogenase expression